MDAVGYVQLIYCLQGSGTECPPHGDPTKLLQAQRITCKAEDGADVFIDTVTMTTKARTETLYEFTFIKPEAGVRGRRGCCVVQGFSSHVVTSINIGSELYQKLDRVRHVDPCRVVQRRLVELH